MSDSKKANQSRPDQVVDTYQKGVSDKGGVASLGQTGAISPNSSERGKGGK